MAIDVAKGAVITVVEEDGPTFNQTPGPEAGVQVVSAVEAAVRQLLEKVVARRRPDAPTDDKTVIMEVSGVKRLADLHRFEEVLGSLQAMVQSVQRESVAPARSPCASSSRCRPPPWPTNCSCSNTAVSWLTSCKAPPSASRWCSSPNGEQF